MPDNVVETRIVAKNETRAPFAEFADTIEAAKKKIQDAGGSVSVFTSALQVAEGQGKSFMQAMAEIASGATSSESALHSASDALHEFAEEAIKKAEESVNKAQESLHHFAESVRSAIENPLASAGAAAERFIMSFGKMGVAVLGAATAIAVAGEKMAEWGKESAEEIMHLEHLSAATGASVNELAGLKAGLQDLGMNGDEANLALGRLARAMDAARDPSSKQAEAFKTLQISTKGWNSELPSLMGTLMKVADGVKNSDDAGRALNATTELMGRGAIHLQGVLKEGAESLGEHIGKYKDLAQAMQENVPAAKQYTEITNEMHQQMKLLSVESLPMVTGALRLLTSAFIAAKIGAEAWRLTIDAAITDSIIMVTAASNAAGALKRGDMSGASDALVNGAKLAQMTWSEAMEVIKSDATDAYQKIDKLWAKAPVEEQKKGAGANDGGAPSGEQEKVDRGAIDALEGQIRHVHALNEAKRLMYAEEEKLGQIGAAANAERYKALLQDELGKDADYLSAKLALYNENDPQYPAAAQRIANEWVAIQDRANAAGVAIANHLSEARRTLQSRFQKEAEAGLDSINKAQAAADAKASADRTKKVEADIKGLIDEEKAASDHAVKMIDLDRGQIEQQYNLGQISGSKRLIALQALKDREYAIELKAAQQELELMKIAAASSGGKDSSYVDKIANQEKQIQAIRDKAAADTLKTTQALGLQEVSVYRGVFAGITRAWDGAVAGLVQGTLTFRQAWTRMGQSIVSEWVLSLAKIAAKHAENIAIRWALESGLSNVLTALHITEVATEAAAGGTERVAEVAGVAALGAANAYASTAAIPIVGPEMAPGVAAATMAAIMAFAPAAAFEGGGMVPGNMLAYLHKDEMVLPRGISQGLQGMIGNGQTSAGAQRGDTHVHLHLSAIDGPSAKKFLSNNRGAVVSMIQGAVRDNAFA